MTRRDEDKHCSRNADGLPPGGRSRPLSWARALALGGTLAAGLLAQACGAESESAVPGTEASAGGGSSDHVATDDPRDDILQSALEGQCAPGQKYACDCPGGAAGTKVCVADDGRYTECGCPVEHPWPGPRCGETECPYLIESDQQFTGGHCCMPDGRCGVTDDEGFGDICYPVHAEPPAVYDSEQCTAYIDFVQTDGCCRQDNQCGWMLVEGNNLDQYGCVEQKELAERLDKSVLLFAFLTFVKGLPFGYLKSFGSTPCTYDPTRQPVKVPGQ